MDEIHINQAPIHESDAPVSGELISMEGETYYKVANTDQMRPFFMSVVSDSNHWMFIASNGGLTAGRKNSEYALFPYYTDDKIIESADLTGSKTLILLKSPEQICLWEPFADTYRGIYHLSRNLYKSSTCNKILFEEINHDLQMVFRYQWSFSNQFGFVKRSTLRNIGNKSRDIRILDGIQNILPCGVTTELQNTRSNLVDAYKKSELLARSGIGTYALSAIIVDRAEPSEALKANTVWSYGIEDAKYLISSLQLDRFRKDLPLEPETDIRAEKGAYFAEGTMNLESDGRHTWYFVANVNQGPSDVAGLRKGLEQPGAFLDLVLKDVQNGNQKLLQLTGSADALQQSGDSLVTTRHYANVMYNIMRGGIFDDNYKVEAPDFKKYLSHANSEVFQRQAKLIADLPDEFTLFELRARCRQTEDADFQRLCYEYLPLKFSRRHGDPSRPWNKFSINTQSETDGSKILDYEGNWRDIFQNWEALAHSYPGAIDGMIHKFLNASTFDGYNPYRITKGGIDWEVIEPDDPWSYIGYWGDHQLIYLLKFLEFSENYYPGRLAAYWGAEMFVYANVPYRIRSYEQILENAKDTIDFDHDREAVIQKRKNEIGSDGALLMAEKNIPYKVNLPEKLLASVLAKVSNLIPGAGIWMNTQRPEWNDANNALVGNGVSVVTLCYLHRFASFLQSYLQEQDLKTVPISGELFKFLNQINEVLEAGTPMLNDQMTDSQRRHIADGLGQAGSQYREGIYNSGFRGAKRDLDPADVSKLIDHILDYTGHAIRANRRADGLYHAYNLMGISEKNGMEISYLDPMLEGQVAVLSSGFLSPAEALEVLDALRKSPLYRKDQNSYMLYPDKKLPRYTEKNNIPESRIAGSKLLQKLLEDGNRQVVERDDFGDYHFNPDFKNGAFLSQALDALPDRYAKWVAAERNEILAIYEELFNHRSFTGRSGTFFGYEGLGSIYWHMVSKLVLAAQESYVHAVEVKSDNAILKALGDHYREIREGIGVHKSPEVYGAIPTDPYSHTPAHKGAQQPGMTGQVKEDILSRERELGITVRGGCLGIDTHLLDRSEFTKTASTFQYVDVEGIFQEVDLPPNALGFTICQVPVVYSLADQSFIELHLEDGTREKVTKPFLSAPTSQEIFSRSGIVRLLKVGIPD